MKQYHFINDSYWNGAGCDCCGDNYEQCYNLDSDIHPDITQNGSSHSIEECFEQVLQMEGIIDEGWRGEDDDMNWEEDWEFLKSVMETHRLQIVIVDEQLDITQVYP